jgi:predicted nucleic acid-binding protein
MNAVDTNVFIYRQERRDLVKRRKARALLQQLHAGSTPTFLLWQVITELVRHLRSRQDQGLLKRAGLLRYLGRVRGLFPLVLPTAAVLDRALDLTGRYSLSHWDSMLLGACLEAGVTTLYTEDMGAPTTIEGIQLINPFI